jgi:hypothetical protein
VAKRRKFPVIRCVTDVVRNAMCCQAGLPDGRWVPARPLPWESLGGRFKAAWLVFTGRADAVTWPGQ